MGTHWIGIRASAALSILGSVITLLLPVSILGVAFFGTARPPDMQGISLKGVAIFVTIFCVGLGAWGIATAVGIFRRREWSRISIVLFAALLTVMGLCCVAAMLFMPLPSANGTQALEPRTMQMVRWGIAVFYGLLALVGVWWLLLFNTAKTKQYFGRGGDAAVAADGGKPVSVVVIAWYLLISAGFTALGGVLRMPAVLFAWVVTGWAAVAVYFLFVAAQIYLGAGLLQLDQRARVGSIVYFCFGAANALGMAAIPGLSDRMDRAIAAMPQWLHLPSTVSMTWDQMSWAMLMGVPIAAVPVWFLVRRRSAFQEGSPG